MERVSRYTPPLRDMRFILKRVLGLQALFELPAFFHVDMDTADAVLNEAGRFTAGVLAPINAVGDEVGSQLVGGRVKTPPGFAEAYRAFVDGGWIALDLPEEWGGQALPLTLQTACAEMVNGACVSFGMLPLMQRAAAALLIAHGDPELVAATVPGLASGECGATIGISEPQAGSDVGRISTKAVKDADGNWRVTGSKIFITYGDQDFTPQIMHLMLARTPDAPAGTRGLSLFAVPARRPDDLSQPNGVTIVRVEHKMGLKASPTCVMALDSALAYLVGPVNEGMRCMFTMMNAMRLEVAVQGVGVAGAATARAMEYAGERCQGGASSAPPVPLVAHADIRRTLFEMRALTEGYRALVLQTAVYLDLAAASESPEERAEALALAEWLLPVCKAGGSEAGFQVANLGVQIFGGHGYVCDQGVEQYVRDSRVMAIYEGANGIQALDLTLRKLGGDGGGRYRLFAKAVQEAIERKAASCPLLAGALAKALKELEAATWQIMSWIEARPRDAEAAATPYLQLVASVALGWMWLRMAEAARGEPEEGIKTATARFVAEAFLPAAHAYARRIAAGAGIVDGVSTTELLDYPE